MKKNLFFLITILLLSNKVISQSNILISTGGTVSVSTGDKFYDAGGPTGDDGNIDYTITLSPAVAGERVVLDFTYFKTHWNWMWDEEDALTIYDGATATGNNIGKLMGDYTVKYNTGVTPYGEGVEAYGAFPAILTPTVFGATNPSGCLTLVFTNGYSSQWEGWEANITTYKPVNPPGCSITMTADNSTICSGESVDLSVAGLLVSAPLNTDFNSSTIGDGWNSTAAASFTTNVCSSPSLDGSVYLWMQNAAGPRTLETNAMDVSNGGEISFEYRQARNNGDASPCECPDQGGGTFEGVYVEYSTDGGANWTTFKYLFPNATEGSFGAEGGLTGCGDYVKEWSKMTYPIPVAAQTTSTSFRWIQAKLTSATSDNWGMDNIIISTPTTATITITDVNTGTVLLTTTDPSDVLTVSPSVTTTYNATITDGIESCDTELTVTVDPCTGCTADVGTFGTSTSGNTINSGVAANEFILCIDDHFLVEDLGGYSAASGSNPDLDYAIYTCAPSPGLDPASDPCFTGSFIETPPTVDEINNGGMSSNIMSYLTGDGQAVTGNTVWLVPITLSVSGASINEWDPACYDMGTPYKVTYLNPITTTEVSDCASASVTVTISGGYPELFTGNYTITNTGAGNLSASSVSSSGGTLIISGLVDGDAYSFSITDDNNCPQTFSGTFSCLSCGTCVNPDCNIAGPYADYSTGASGANHCSQMNDISSDPVNGETLTTYHQLTSSSSGTVGLIVSVGVNAVVGGTACPVTRVATIYPIGGPCDSSTGIASSTTTANGSPYYNPEWTGLTPNTNYVVEITFTVPAGCDMLDHCESFYFPPSCSADVGTITVTGGNLVTTNEYGLTNCETISFAATNEELNGGALTYGWAVFSCDPGASFLASEINDFTNHPCYVGSDYGTSTSDTDAGGISASIPGDHDTLWIVPYTSDVANSADGDGDGCYDIGEVIQINYLAPSCGDCSTPDCSIGSVNEFADRTYALCNDPCADLNNTTYVTYHTINTDTYGNVGVVQQLNFSQFTCSVLTRTAVLRDVAGSCGGTDILPGVQNANGVGSGFNPEWTGLTPSTSYTLIITTIIGSDCNYDFACVDFYGIPGCDLAISSVNVVDAGCNNNEGEVEVLTSGSVGIIEYTLNGVLQTDVNVFSNLPGDSYFVEIEDENSCTDTLTVSIEGSTPISFVDFIINPPTCYGYNDGNVTASVVGGSPIYSYAWSNSLAGTNVSQAVDVAAGVYSLTVTDQNACTVDTLNFVVNNPTMMSIDSIVVSNELCFGQCDGSISIYSPTATDYGIDGGVLSSNNQFLNLCNGDYDLQLMDNSGCILDTLTTVSSPIEMEVTSDMDLTICMGQTASLGTSVVGGTGVLSYSWDNGAGMSSNPSVSPSGSTTYTVIVTDENNCTDNAIQEVIVQDALSVITYTDTLICVGTLANVNAIASGGDGNYFYAWDLPAIGSSQVVSPAVTTNYTVTVSDGCGSTPVEGTVLITVQDLPDATFTNSYEACDEVNAVFVANDLNNSAYDGGEFEWDFANGMTSSDRDSSQLLYATAGCYDVSYSITDGLGCSNSYTLVNAVCVYESPIAGFSSSPQEVNIINSSVDFLNESSGNSNLTYQWEFDFTDSVGISSDVNPSITFPNEEEGVYEACLYVTNENNCSDSICQNIEVEGVLFFYVPNAFTPDGNGFNDEFLPILGGVQVEDYQLLIYNRWGELIFETDNIQQSWNGEVNSKGVQEEVYVWRIDFLNPLTNRTVTQTGHVTLIK